MGKVSPIREDKWAPLLCLVSHLKGINREALSLIYTHLTLSSSHERDRDSQIGEIDSHRILHITTFDHLTIMKKFAGFSPLWFPW